MAQIIKADGVLLLAGMHWLYPESEKQSAKKSKSFLSKFAKPAKGIGAVSESALISAKKATHAAGSTRNAWGYLTASEKRALSKAPRFAKVYSLAELFSAQPSLPVCAILIAQIPGETDFAMCTSINGHPAPGDFDVVVPASAVESTLQHWEKQLRLLGTTGEPALYGTWGAVAHSLTLEKLALNAAAVPAVRAVGTDVRQLATAIVIAGAGFLGYLAWEDYQLAQSAKNAQALAQQQAPSVVYQNALNAQWSTQPWGSLGRARAMQQHIRQVREYVGGFKISTPVTCDIISGTCTFSYKKDADSSATFNDFIADVRRQFVVTSFGQDGQTVEVSMTLQNLPAATVPSLDGLANETESPLLFWPRIQKLVLTQKVSGTLTKEYKVFPQNLGINEAAVPMIVRSTGVAVTYPLWDLVEIPTAGGVFTNAINWKTLTAGSGAVTLAGELYAKKTNP
ncbi:hypothetical protein ACFPOU_08145 [Massilia jejuensis]|uniref:Pilin accessory protein (PilO) n=1 Tax=Massilia jejuensis TaxID=648894 RepID=A0ABW0PEL9_9BURK